MNRLIHSLNELRPLSVVKDLNLIFLLYTIIAFPLSPESQGELGINVMVSVMYLGPVAVFWTPFVQERLCFSKLKKSRNVKYQWLIYLSLIFLPIFGLFILLILLAVSYGDEDLEDKLNITTVDKRKQSGSKEDEDVERDSGYNFNTVKEYKRTCNECGKTWHSLAKREKKIKRSKMYDECQEALSACYCNMQASSQYRKNANDTKSELEKLKECPECGSRNYEEEVIEYEDK